MSIALYHFGSQVIRGAAVGVSSVNLGFVVRPSEVAELHIAIVDKNVLRLKVSVDYRGRLVMQIINRLDYLPEILFALSLAEPLALDPLVERALLREFHHQVNFLSILEDGVEPDYVRVIQRGEYFDLVVELPEQPLLSELLLRDHLQRIQLVVLKVPDLEHLSERARADLIQKLETLLEQRLVLVELDFSLK